MLISILTIISAFTWLMTESDFLRVNLIGETLEQYDKRILAEMQSDNQIAYQAWIDKQWEPVFKICYQRDKETMYECDKWMAEDEDLQKRRNGEMLYQRR